MFSQIWNSKLTVWEYAGCLDVVFTECGVVVEGFGRRKLNGETCLIAAFFVRILMWKNLRFNWDFHTKKSESYHLNGRTVLSCFKDILFCCFVWWFFVDCVVCCLTMLEWFEWWVWKYVEGSISLQIFWDIIWHLPGGNEENHKTTWYLVCGPRFKLKTKP